ncbi:MAG: M56 family metallopeptidase, partial [Victivallaceae bacterium]
MIANFLLMLISSLVKGGVFCLILNLNRRFSLIVKSGEKYFLVLGMLCFVLLPLGVPYLKTEFKAFDNKIAVDPKNITVPAITPPLAASSPKLPPIAETSKSTAVLSAVVSGDNVSASSIPLTTQQVESGAHEPKVVADVSVPEVEVTAATEIAVPANEAAAESGFFWRNIYLFYLYLGVSLGWLVIKGVRIFYVARILRRLPQLSDVSLLDLGRKFAIPVNAMYNGDNYCETPAGCGIFRKTFLLPQSRLINCSVSEISWLLAHEKAHFNHYDNVVKFIIYWLETLMWFNPFFFMLRRQLFNLMEQRCDEKVVSEFGLERGERVAYSKLLSNFALGRNIILTNNLSNNGKSFLERINAIMMEYTLPSRRILLSELLIACATVAVLMPFISRADKSMDWQISSDATNNPEAFGVHRGGGEFLNFVERNWSESKAAGLNWLNDFYTVAVLDSWRNHLQKSLDGAKYKAEKGLASYADFEQVEYKLMLLDCRYPSSNTAYLKAINRCRDILLQRLTARKRGSANPDEVEQAEKKLLCFEIAFEYHKDAEARLAAINQLYKIFERRL